MCRNDCIILALALCLASCNDPPRASDSSAVEQPIRDGQCDGCRIELRELAILGSLSDSASVQVRPSGCFVERLTTGEFLMSAPVGGGRILVYGPDGGPVVRTIGRYGAGPGELGSRRLTPAVGRGDTVHVYDVANNRFSVYTSSGEVVRSFILPWSVSRFALLPGSGYLVHRTQVPADTGRASLFYRLDFEGREIARFGTATADQVDVAQWVLSPDGDSRAWTAYALRYSLQHWSDNNAAPTSFVRDAPWFPPEFFVSDSMYVVDPPPPTLQHIWRDAANRLWTYTWVPDGNFKPGPVENRPGWYARTFDTVIEVIDVRTMEVLARTTVDARLTPACNSTLSAEIRETPEGDTRTVVFQPVLVPDA
jgi:hypothetical protein